MWPVSRLGAQKEEGMRDLRAQYEKWIMTDGAMFDDNQLPKAAFMAGAALALPAETVAAPAHSNNQLPCASCGTVMLMDGIPGQLYCPKCQPAPPAPLREGQSNICEICDKEICQHAVATLVRLEAERNAAQQAVKRARVEEVESFPCPPDCKSNFGLGTLPCDCWKAERLADLREKGGGV